MSKLPKAHKFIDLSDYGRRPGRFIANQLKHTKATPIHVTIGFAISGALAIVCMLKGYFWAAAILLILKSILDAADGELARIKKTPSYTGRYLDSVSDIIINLFLFIALWQITNTTIWAGMLAFAGLQLQGTLYNYYYVILRNNLDGDTTSRIIEDQCPKALPGEKQEHVNILFYLYIFFYGLFDKSIYYLDQNAPNGKVFPNWFMTAISTFGLGFQLLLIALFLVMGYIQLIIPFFIGYSLMVFVFIAIRKQFLN